MIDNCSDSLAVPELTIVNGDKRRRLASLKLTQRDTYTSNSQAADAMIPVKYGQLNGSWEKFDAARDQYLFEEKFDLDEQECISLLQIKPNPKALDAWKACMLKHQFLICWVDDASADRVQVGVKWDGPQGLQTLTSTQLTVTDGDVVNDPFSGNPLNGETVVVIKRPVGGGPVRGNVRGKSGGFYGWFAGDYAATFRVPAHAASAHQLQKETKAQNAGALNDAAVEFTSKVDQKVRVYGFCATRYGRPGNPNGSCWLYLNGAVHGSKTNVQLHSPFGEFTKFGQKAFGTLVYEWDFEWPVYAGESLKASAHTTNENGNSDTLFLAIDYLV